MNLYFYSLFMFPGLQVLIFLIEINLKNYLFLTYFLYYSSYCSSYFCVTWFHITYHIVGLPKVPNPSTKY